MKINNYFKGIFLYLLFFSCSIYSQDTINIKKYGLFPNSKQNAIPFINKCLSDIKGNKNPIIIFFEEGRYDFWPEGSKEEKLNISNTTAIEKVRLALDINNMENITIECNNSNFIFHNKFQPLTIRDSKNISINNVAIDWEIPFTAESKILKVNDDCFYLEIDYNKYPYTVEKGKLYFVGEEWKSMWGGEKWNDPICFDSKTMEVLAESHDDLLGYGWENIYTAEEIKKGIVKINYNKNQKLKEGDYMVLRHSVRDHCGIFIDKSSNVYLNNIKMYSNTGLSYLAQFSENIYLNKAHCIPSPDRDIISGHDDGLHFSNCKGEIVIDGCIIKGLMDDAVNVHSSYVFIEEIINDTTIVCKFPHFQSAGFTWAYNNDNIMIINGKTMEEKCSNEVTGYEKLSRETFKLYLKNKISSDIKINDGVENTTWQPKVNITNCYFGHHRARGVLVSTREKVIIKNNTFNTSGAAIAIPGDLNVYSESGPITDMEISNNRFLGGCLTSEYLTSKAIITIGIERKDNKQYPSIHKNIRIEDNYFEMFDHPILYAECTKNITFNNNVIQYVNTHKPWHNNKYTFNFTGCKNISLKNNIFKDFKWEQNIKLNNMSKSQIDFDKKQIKIEE